MRWTCLQKRYHIFRGWVVRLNSHILNRLKTFVVSCCFESFWCVYFFLFNLILRDITRSAREASMALVAHVFESLSMYTNQSSGSTWSPFVVPTWFCRQMVEIFLLRHLIKMVGRTSFCVHMCIWSEESDEDGIDLSDCSSEVCPGMIGGGLEGLRRSY